MQKGLKSKLYQLAFIRKGYERFCALCYFFSKKLGVKIQFRMVMGYSMDFDNPQTLNQKVQWLKFYDNSLLKRDCVDKYLVRNYVERKGLKNILNSFEGKGVYSSFAEIDFDELPERFVLKCNHGCGTNAVIKNKKEIDKACLKKRFDEWMGKEFGHRYYEPQYFGIKPRILCERYLEDERYKELPDYKLYCCNGRVEMTIVMLDRYKDTATHYYHFDRDWHYLESNDSDLSKEEIVAKIPRPNNLDEMYQVAEKLAEDFVFVRVDLYDVNSKIYFGELTFTPTGGLDSDYSRKIDEYLGEKIKLVSYIGNK